MDARATNRLSGFFTSLIHRRPEPSPGPPASPPSPAPGRPVTPPPPLPAPSLHELGLSLSVLTADLSPSPPTSGAFLSPHFLLLCHPQGLDVLPLLSSPDPQPIALVRRVSFKSVVVMEQRGVLVAIAGRRDGVRVYALDDIKKNIQWRIDTELRRERDRSRKKLNTFDIDSRNSTEKLAKNTLSADPTLVHIPPVPLIPRSPTPRTPRKSRAPPVHITPPAPNEHPPPYSSPLDLTHPPRLPPARTHPHPDIKADWAESSDDEAIDIVAAEASGSQALDERTSATLSGNAQSSPIPSSPRVTPPRRRNRPANLDLSLTRTDTIVPPQPSPTPTLLTLRHALSSSPTTRRTIHTSDTQDTDTHFGVGDDDDGDDDDGVSLTRILMESRLPGLPPAGTQQPQRPVLLSSTAPAEPESENPAPEGLHPAITRPSFRRHRRWSALLGGSPIENVTTSSSVTTLATPARLPRSQSFRSQSSNVYPSNDSSASHTLPEMSQVAPSRSSRFLTRILSNAFPRKAQDRPPIPAVDMYSTRRPTPTPIAPQAPPPKLDYVKLPGTKGALMVKAVETAKKSFLAILCGENGEKVELFAGTYRTALGLSRTFILPDSPRSLELQLQGDDLVEVFLVFSQNVFGLEPATVRVREVRIGRAERRAARRRAREIRAGENVNHDLETVGEEDTNVNVSIGVAVDSTGAGDGADTPGVQPDATTTPDTATIAQSEELVAVATAQMGPYTTFQQLSFAPKFPLASIADEYIIPPTYPSFLEYRAEHEPEEASATDLSQIQFTPPGLPVPVPTAPSRWYYRDPKNVIHGPWKASLMQAWYKDGLLPLDLPVRREEDDDFLLLKDLRLQGVDPTHPFRPPPPPASTPLDKPAIFDAERPLLSPISLLTQPRHFGPPALFFSSRGGHSTAIVDARGRSVLKGRFVWSPDEQDDDSKSALMGRMGDIKRLEALDVDDRSVLVAMRQGGLEAVDLSDALLRPADESRTVLPQFAPPVSNINRRAPFVWKIGMPVSSCPTTATVLSKGKESASYLSGKKSSNPAVRSEFSLGDMEVDSHEEVLFLGRMDDNIYFCERNTGSFRILRLCPSIA
ncbi:GYF domain-containing protein mpd2 [Termitomyces sp. T112]|nr:GYF domain-containing protein mpd2 [Termitomyces sp. T112]